jgi:PAS domain-containing protein
MPTAGKRNEQTLVPIHPTATVEVNEDRRYVSVNDSACKLLGYSREELLQLSIDDLALPSAAHVPAMFNNYSYKGKMEGIFALKRKTAGPILIKFKAETIQGRFVAEWTHYREL